MSLIIRDVCPACNKKKFRLLFSIPYNSEKMINFLDKYYNGRIGKNKLKGFYYRLIQCKFCNLIFQEQIPDESFSEELYENIIDKEDSLFKKENFEKKYYKKLIYEMGLLKGIFKERLKHISILEFGAGWGFWSNHLKDNHLNVSAFEVSESRIKNLKKNSINVITNIETINQKFDFIYSEETFEHISKPKETLIKLSKILNKDGFILLRFPSSFLFKFKLSKNYKPKKDCAHPLEHINSFSKKSFISMIKNTDLEIINLKSKFNFSINNFLRDIKNFAYFNSVLIKKINK